MPKSLLIIVVLLLVCILGFYLLNPAELLRQGRDRQRENDLNSLKSAIEAYISNNSSSILVNADFCPNCTEGKVYTFSGEAVSGGVTTVARGNVYINSTGWVPLDLTLNAKAGSTQLKMLPVDPLEKINLALDKIPLLNSLSPKRDGFVYTFSATKTGKYKLTAKMESKAGLAKAKNDSGHLDDRLEIGNDLDLKP